MNLQCRIIVLDLIQLHLCSLESTSSVILVSMNIDAKDSDSIEDVESQLDQRTLDSNDDLVDVSTQTL